MEKKEAEAGKKSVTVERTKGVMMQNKAEGVGWGPKRGEETTARWPQVVVKTRSHVRTEKRREEKRSKRRRWKGSRERGREGGKRERVGPWWWNLAYPFLCVSPPPTLSAATPCHCSDLLPYVLLLFYDYGRLFVSLRLVGKRGRRSVVFSLSLSLSSSLWSSSSSYHVLI